jgi:hypothetical protein
MSMSSRFSIRAEDPAYARQIVRSALGDADGDAVETAALLTSELVTNAMVLAHADPDLFLDAREGHIYVEVRNADSDRACRPSRTQWMPRGWGLDMINALATSWGSESRRDCDAVWFALSFSSESECATPPGC